MCTFAAIRKQAVRTVRAYNYFNFNRPRIEIKPEKEKNEPKQHQPDTPNDPKPQQQPDTPNADDKQLIFYVNSDYYIGYTQAILSLGIFIICCLCYSGFVGIIGCISGVICSIWNKRKIEAIMPSKKNIDLL